MRSVWRMAVLALLGLGLTGCMWLFTPPQAVLTAGVTSGTAPLSVTFTLSGSTGQITGYTLAFGDASAPATGTDITVAVVHAYTAPGTYTATLTVQDNRGRTSSATVVITVTAPATTSVSLGALPASGPAPLDVAFWATITAASGRRIKHLKLEYGDGEPDFEAVVDFTNYDFFLIGADHPYADPGVYTATLTVTDDAPSPQIFTATATITVTSPPPEITEFKADGVNFDDPDPTLTITSGDTVTFEFEADPATGRKIKKWTLLCPGSDIPSAGEDDLAVDPLDRSGLTRTYTHTETGTQIYTSTLKVWDDVGNWDEAVINIEVDPAP